MIATDEAALECDLMETYRIPCYRELPARRAALFAYGLGEGSRIRKKLSGALVGLDTLILAQIADALNLLVWFQTEAGQKGEGRPASITALLRGKPVEQEESVGFDSAEDFDAWRASRLGGG